MTTFLNLSWPFLACGLLATAAILFGPSDSVEVLIPIGLTQVVFQGSGLVAGKALLVIGALAALAIPAFRDYSRLYPVDLRFNVSFDREGLQDALDKLPAEARITLPIVSNWPEQQRVILGGWNELMARNQLPGHVTLSEATRGTGYVTFKVVSVKGWQAYQITAAEGQMSLQFPIEGQSTKLRIDFELVPGPSTRIEGSLKDIYLRWTKVIRPRFTQYAHMTPLQRLAVGEVIAVTKLRFFPIMTIGRTVYFTEMKSRDEAAPLVVPIAYAVYES